MSTFWSHYNSLHLSLYFLHWPFMVHAPNANPWTRQKGYIRQSFYSESAHNLDLIDSVTFLQHMRKSLLPFFLPWHGLFLLTFSFYWYIFQELFLTSFSILRVVWCPSWRLWNHTGLSTFYLVLLLLHLYFYVLECLSGTVSWKWCCLSQKGNACAHLLDTVKFSSVVAVIFCSAAIFTHVFL